jgi:hypothetical protein
LAGIIARKAGPINQRIWTIQVHDDGPGASTPAAVKSFTFQQTSGASACKPAVKTELPAVVGNIAPSGNASIPITIDFNGCPQDARFSTQIVMVANEGEGDGLHVYA